MSLDPANSVAGPGARFLKAYSKTDTSSLLPRSTGQNKSQDQSRVRVVGRGKETPSLQGRAAFSIDMGGVVGGCL